MVATKGVLAAVLLAFSLRSARAALPSCLNACSVQSTTPCTPDSLPALIRCLNDHCSSNNSLARYAVTLSPKIEYSCQQSYVPGDDTPTAVLKMTGQGHCETSPYDFQSFISSAGNNPWASGVCRMFIYPEEQCEGQPKNLPLTLHTVGCTFEGGRSARLDCSEASDISVARQYVQRMCSNTTLPGTGSDSNAGSTLSTQSTCTSANAHSTSSGNAAPSHSGLYTAASASIPGSISPFGSVSSSRLNSTMSINSSSGLNSTLSTGTSTPYLGGAVKESNDATIAAMFALIAAFILL